MRLFRSSCCSVNLSHAVQGIFQEPAFAAGPHHVDGHFAEHTRVAGHGFGQRGPVFHAAMDVVQHLLQPRMRRLLAEHLHRPQQRHAAAQQGCQLAVGGRHQLAADALRLKPAALAFSAVTSTGNSDWPDRMRQHFAFGGGGDRAGDPLAL